MSAGIESRQEKSVRLNKNRRGFLYTLEVLIAFSIVFVAMAFLFKNPPMKPELELSIIKLSGYNALEYMDRTGDLRRFVSDSDELSLENRLSALVSNSIGFETEICRSFCNSTNVPANATVLSVDYYVSGYKDAYSNQKVRLLLWKKYER